MYGRPLRAPAQLHEPPIAHGDARPGIDPKNPDSTERYVTKLHEYLKMAWQTAANKSEQGQEKNAEEAYRTENQMTFEKGDRVCRRLHDRANKLVWGWAGPYRVEEVMGNGNYRLRDLENNLTVKVIHVSHLRPYKTIVDEEPLAPEEYIIEKIIGRRKGRGHTREYRVKWEGYPLSKATWEPENMLRLRDAVKKMLDKFDSKNPDPAPPAKPPGTGRKQRRAEPPEQGPSTDKDDGPAPSPLAEEDTAATDDTELRTGLEPNTPTGKDATAAEEPDQLPTAAKFERKCWHYEKLERGRRGTSARPRWFPEYSFSAQQRESAHFQRLRSEHLAQLRQPQQ